ncbi:MAG: HAMP domain-containing protein [Pseudomonadales bacterium]|nr:HAMP domain-containing protein [Pseudomonadales bacterium]
MSIKTKTIIILIILSLTPYIITMGILGNAYRTDIEERVRYDMQNQLDITVDRLDQTLRSLDNDLRFVSSLDVMNDIITQDLDQRIFSLLLLKKNDLDLIGNFFVLDTSERVVASTDIESLGEIYSGPRFEALPIFSTFDERQAGTLLVDYSEENLTRLFPQTDTLRYSMLSSQAALPQDLQRGDYILVERPLEQRPEWRVVLAQDTDFAFSALNRLTRVFFIALVIGVFTIATVAYLIANYIVNPILALSTTARSITRTQDYSQRVAVNRKDEIGQLSTAFNHMISGMQEMIARVREEGENRLKLAQEKDRAEMLQTLSNKLSKYLSPQIYESIFSGEKDVTLSSSRKKLTIFFSDIVNFTGTTDKMESEDLTQLLNQYLDEMTSIALEYGATVDKYIGDAIMIFFGDPHTKGVTEDAVNCVRMAVAMQKRVNELQGEWQAAGFTKPFKIRIGIHTGFCTVGNFGTENRMEYTIIGSSVNLASRIESSARPDSIYLSEDTYLLVKNAFQCIPVESVVPKGLSDPLQLYRVVTMLDEQELIQLDAQGVSLMLEKSQISPQTRQQLQDILQQLDSGSED